jgi:2'-5' RNA ligase
MRSFIALELPEDVKARISGLIEALRPFTRSVRWVRAENIHLTLKFLGEVPENSVDEIGQSIVRAAGVHAPFKVVAAGTGAFPGPRRPRVIWAGLDGGQELLSLHSDIERVVETLGFIPESREFRAHLTIGRVKNPKGLSELMKELKEHEDDAFGEFEAQKITLFKSDLLPSGARYTPLVRAPLGR